MGGAGSFLQDVAPGFLAGTFGLTGAALQNAVEATQILVHGAVQGALTVTQGGHFLQGFASGAISEAATIGTRGQDIALRVAAVSAAGGLSAQLTGGKFANGAISAAFAFLYNACGHEHGCTMVGTMLGASLGVTAAAGCDFATWGVCAIGNPAIVTGSTAGGAVFGAALDKYYDQLINLLSKVTTGGPLSSVYQLVAEQSGYYPNVRTGIPQWLNANEVWKYGKNNIDSDRYSDAYLQRQGPGVREETLWEGGNASQAFVVEKMYLIQYFGLRGALPPGNCICK